MSTLTGDTPDLDEHCIHKLPTSCRLTSTPKCCACVDLRPHRSRYSTYMDGIGFVNRATRWSKYCWYCKQFWDNRIASTSPPIQPKDTKIPDEPDQTSFLDQWHAYHRAHLAFQAGNGAYQAFEAENADTIRDLLINGMDWRDTAPGHLPVPPVFSPPIGATIPPSSLQTPSLPQDPLPTELVSLQSTLDNLIQDAEAEDNTTHIPTDPSSSNARGTQYDMANIQPGSNTNLATQQSGHESSGITSHSHQSTGNDLLERVERLTQISNQLDNIGAQLNTVSQQPSRDAPGNRSARNFERVFGSREEIQQLGTNYVSPLTSMFDRAFDRYRVAEELRAEERLANENFRRFRHDLDALGTRADEMEDEANCASEYARAIERMEGRETERFINAYREAQDAQRQATRARRRYDEERSRDPVWERMLNRHEQRTISGRVIRTDPTTATAEQQNRDDAQANTMLEYFRNQEGGMVVDDSDATIPLSVRENRDTAFPGLPEDWNPAVQSSGTAWNAPDRTLDDQKDERPEAKTDQELQVKLDCKICFTQLAEVATLPCGHLSMCTHCSNIAIPGTSRDPTKPADRTAKCPICRVNVKRLARIYLT